MNDGSAKKHKHRAIAAKWLDTHKHPSVASTSVDSCSKCVDNPASTLVGVWLETDSGSQEAHVPALLRAAFGQSNITPVHMCQIAWRDDATIIRPVRCHITNWHHLRHQEPTSPASRKGAGSKVEVVVEVAHTAKASVAPAARLSSWVCQVPLTDLRGVEGVWRGTVWYGCHSVFA